MNYSLPLKSSYRLSLTLTIVGLFLFNLPNSYSQNTGAGSPIKDNPNNKVPVSQPEKSAPTASQPSPGVNFHRHAVAIGLGQTFLFGDFNDLGEDKVAFPDLYYIYKASYTFQFLVNFHSNSYDLNGQEVTLTSLNLGIKSKLFDFDNFAPYVTGGLGFYWPRADRFINSATVLTESESKGVMGINLGAGMDLELNDRYTFGLLGHYHHPFRSKQDSQPSLEGYYFKLLLTLSYAFL